MTEKLEFRDAKLAGRVADKIRRAVQNERTIKICHVCGTHEYTITHFGLRTLLPSNVEVIAGPGCPVCIVPASEVDEAVELAQRGIVVTCFGDVLRVPGSEMSLLDAKALGADVRVVYSLTDAIKMAQTEENKEFVFFAVGFETTSPSTAVEVANKPPKNISFLVSHRLIPPAMKLLAEMEDLGLDGFIAPGHVSTIIGLKPYEIFPKTYRVPTVIAGFEPLDILMSVYMILRQQKRHAPKLENEYIRAVHPEGNTKAQEIMNRVFDVTDSNWRGLGTIPTSRFLLKGEHSSYDANLKYGVKIERGIDIQQGCKCHLVVVGKTKPAGCPLFMKRCTPENPIGACMVSNEGTCRIWARTTSLHSPPTAPI
jgi:hydrogenase expression/formation protein HypD